jgi:hypothetical protein
MQKPFFDKLFILLQIAVVAVFLGRAWQHLYWEAPYRVLLWDEDWMKPVVEGILGWKWEDYVTSARVDQNIQIFIRGTGVFYLICAFAAIFIRQWKRIATIILWLGSFSLIFLAALYCKDKFFHLGQFLEYTSQSSSPIFLILLHQQQVFHKRWMFAMKIAIAFTFICHGLYAIGYYPRPGDFMQMTMAILHINEIEAVQFLKIVGLLDFTAGVLLFMPGRIGKIALYYCIFWGLATTLARIWAPLALGASVDNVVLQSLHESLYRFPHFLMPLVVVLVLDRQNLGDAQ